MIKLIPLESVTDCMPGIIQYMWDKILPLANVINFMRLEKFLEKNNYFSQIKKRLPRCHAHRYGINFRSITRDGHFQKLTKSFHFFISQNLTHTVSSNFSVPKLKADKYFINVFLYLYTAIQLPRQNYFISILLNADSYQRNAT